MTLKNIAKELLFQQVKEQHGDCEEHECFLSHSIWNESIEHTIESFYNTGMSGPKFERIYNRFVK